MSEEEEGLASPMDAARWVGYLSESPRTWH